MKLLGRTLAAVCGFLALAIGCSSPVSTSGPSTAKAAAKALTSDWTAPDMSVTGIPGTKQHNKQVIGYLDQWDAWKSTANGLPSAGALTHLNIDYSQYTILNFCFFGIASDGSLHSGDYRNPNIYQTGAVQTPSPIFDTDPYSSWDLWILFGDQNLVQYISPDIVTQAAAQGFVCTAGGSTWSNPTWGLSGSLPMPIHKAGSAPGLLELAHKNGVKVMATVGGWSMCRYYPVMAANPTMRAKFIHDCQTLINVGFDGIDLDWEYPGPYSGMNFTGTQADYANYVTLMTELRTAIGPTKLITGCFSADPKKLAGFDWPTLAKLMDYFNFMTYDYNGGWSDHAGHNSPVHDYPSSEFKNFNWDSLLAYLQTTPIDFSKVNFGVPFYGRGVVTTGNPTVGTATVKVAATVNPDGPITTCADYTNWPLNVWDGTPNYEYVRQTALGTGSGWTLGTDPAAGVPYATKGNFFLSYDDPVSMALKAQFIKDHRLAGAIVWTVFGDLQFGGTETDYGTKLKVWNGVKSPLVNALNATFANGVVVTPSPTPTAIPSPSPTPVSSPAASPTPLATPSPTPPTVLASGVPGSPTLSQSNWNGAPTYTITMNMWWGNNGTTWQLFENGNPVYTAYLSDTSPNAQAASYTFTNKPQGTYTYTSKLVNSYGATSGSTLSYTVTQGPTTSPAPTPTAVPTPSPTPTGTVKATGVPGTPNLTQSTWNGESTFTLTMNMWWGNNGTSWQVFENGYPVYTATLTDNSPNSQTASFTLSNKANGTYTYTSKLTNSFGTTVGNTLSYTVTKGGTTVPTPTATPTTSPVPTPSVTPTPVPTVTPVPGVLAKHALMGYYQDFVNGAQVLKLTDVPASYNMIIVAFANATGVPGQVSFSVDSGLSAAVPGGYSDAQFKADIATCEARGQIVIFSVGGQNGTISVSDSTSAANFAASVNSIMSAWGFQGVDIDLENGVSPTYMAQALHAVKAGSVITLAPQTVDVLTTGSSYLALALNIKDILTVINCQYYNSGAMNGYDGTVYGEGTEDFLTDLATTQLQSGLANSQVGLGLPASPSGAGSGYVSPTVINNSLDCLTRGTNPGAYHPPTTYPGLRGVMDWSINWDASSGYSFANAIAPHLTTLP